MGITLSKQYSWHISRPTAIQVNIYTEAPGYSAEEVEALILGKIERYEWI